jgi:hypothetical protein
MNSRLAKGEKRPLDVLREGKLEEARVAAEAYVE